jgi:single-strand DNA-binding protein
MRRITLIGNLTADAEVKDVGTKKVINFAIGTSEKFKDQQGVSVEKSYYYNCSIWRDSNVNVAKYLTKGTKVFIEGTPEVEVYKDKEGTYKGSIKVSVANLELIGSGNKEGSQTTTFNNDGSDIDRVFGRG